MKKRFLFIIFLIVGSFIFQACNVNKADEEKAAKIKVVTSIFSSYDWVKEVSKGANVSITNLTDNGVNLHNYDPTPEDITKILESDLFIYVGAHSDKWAKKIVNDNPSLNAINLTEVLKDKLLNEEIKEGMEDPDACPCGEDHHKGHSDEHVWLSLKNAKSVVKEIADKLISIDPDNKTIYENNFKDYTNRLDELDKKYEAKISKSKNKTMIFGDRFPFRYLLNDYGLDYYAAFFGCSAESEASFDTIMFLVKKIDELGLNYIYSLTDSDNKIADTISDNVKHKVEILKMNSLETVKSTDNESYLSIMEKNLEEMAKGLN